MGCLECRQHLSLNNDIARAELLPEKAAFILHLQTKVIFPLLSLEFVLLVEDLSPYP